MADRKIYTAEQKADALKRVEELGLTKAAKKLGISATSLTKWKAEAELADAGQKAGKKGKNIKARMEEAASSVADQAVASEIAAKKSASKAKRTVKEKLSSPVEKAAGDLKAKTDEVRLANEIEKGRARARNERKASEKKEKAGNVRESVKKPLRKAAAAKLNIKIQSPMGGVITPEEIAGKVPKEATDVYVRIDENRLYWVGPQGAGSVEIWN